MAAWNSGENFFSCWSSKKELLTASITRRGERTFLQVDEYCDEGLDLIDDAIQELSKSPSLQGYAYLKSYGIEQILNFMYFIWSRWGCLETEIQVNEPNFRASKSGKYRSFSQMLGGINQLANKTAKANERNYSLLKQFCRNHIQEYVEEGGDSKNWNFNGDPNDPID